MWILFQNGPFFQFFSLYIVSRRILLDSLDFAKNVIFQKGFFSCLRSDGTYDGF